ncbi:PLDc N-terminal domain-containing protein [Oceanirhabdus sp. W0125-5]|uniref:PLDc N-terminal domain-containing protein n=1 Tax=Oceanirhabdus sp. W0125-5 TaxID=2999116 RepID=UPI0022F2D1C6|nr:PLDc N-terminal domain-containing protein [Oceanirhabdus sp. W0125-5]WBW98336.1 PLDc N-terminal domain-containing protein [Oceanirhabdus sp. W0125-5]
MNIDLRLIIPIVIMNGILLLIAGVDLIKRDKLNVRGGNKLIWVPIILLISFVGPVVYLTVGRTE